MEERLRALGIHLEDAKLLAVDLAEMCSVAPSRQRTVLVVQRSIRSLAGLVRRPARGARRRGSGSKDAEDAAPAPCRIHGAPIPRARRARRTPSSRRTCNDQAWATARMAQPVGDDGGSGGGGAWRSRSRGHRPTPPRPSITWHDARARFRGGTEGDLAVFARGNECVSLLLHCNAHRGFSDLNRWIQ